MVEIAKAIGTSLFVPVDLVAIVKAKDTPELKNVFDFKERTSTLKGAFKVNEKAVRGKRILLVDDLYRSGATASNVAQALIAGGRQRLRTDAVGRREQGDPEQRDQHDPTEQARRGLPGAEEGFSESSISR